MQISTSSLEWLQNFDADLIRRTNKFQVSIYSVYILASAVKWSQIFIQQQIQEIFITNF